MAVISPPTHLHPNTLRWCVYMPYSGLFLLAGWDIRYNAGKYWDQLQMDQVHHLISISTKYFFDRSIGQRAPLNTKSIIISHFSEVQICLWGKIYSKCPWRNPQEKSQYCLIFVCTLSATTAWILIIDASGQTVVLINIIRFITFRAVPVATFLPGRQVLPSCHRSSFLTSHSGWSSSDPRTRESHWWFRVFMGQNRIHARWMNQLCIWWVTCQLV